MNARLLPILAVVALCGCATQPDVRCGSGEQEAVNQLLYFGTERSGAPPVSIDQWNDFLRDAVTPRFPQGLTTWQADGQWRSADGTLVREGSFVLNLVHPASPQAEREIQGIVSEYKRRFQQEAVLRVKSPACTTL